MLTPGAAVLDSTASSFPLVADVKHIDGYEAWGPYRHVAGSACCLDFSIEADGPEACKMYCSNMQSCGAFLFQNGECYLVSKDSNFQPVDGPGGCERRCAERDLCEAFVYAPSSGLCFLVYFPTHASAIPWNSSIRPASDRVFGLVRDRYAETVQTDVGAANRSLPLLGRNDVRINQFRDTSMQEEHSLPPMEFAWSGELFELSYTILGSALATAVFFFFATSVILLGQSGSAKARPRWPEMDGWYEDGACNVDISTASLVVSSPGCPTNVPEETRYLDETPLVTTPQRPADADQISERESSPATDARDDEGSKVALSLPTSCISVLKTDPHCNLACDTPPKTAPLWRERVREEPAKTVPSQRSMCFAGPTNYPVSGDVSPNALGTPMKLLLREEVDGETLSENCAGEVDTDMYDAAGGVLSVGRPEILLAVGVCIHGALAHETQIGIAFALILFSIVSLSGFYWLAISVPRAVNEHALADRLADGDLPKLLEEDATSEEKVACSSDGSLMDPHGRTLRLDSASDLQHCQGGE